MKTRCVIVACALLLAPAPACAGMIVGIGNSGPLFTGTTFFAVDPITGSTTPFGQFRSSQYYAASSSAVDGTFFALSPVNVYRINPFTGEFVGYLCYVAEDCSNAGSDPAYDPSNHNTYSLASIGNAPGLVQMVDRGPLLGSSLPGSHRVSYEPIGNLGVSGIGVIEYIPGLGLYGTSSSAGYLIDETTGHASLLAPLTGIVMPITGLAYSFDTGHLLASAGVLFSPGTGMIYQLDPLTGHATVLNAQAPNLVGIAYTTIPEAQPTWMLAGGLALWFTLRKRLCTVR
jgi:hypothetical protein